MIVLPSSFTMLHRQRIIDFAARYQLPAVYGIAASSKMVASYPMPTVWMTRSVRAQRMDQAPLHRPQYLQLNHMKDVLRAADHLLAVTGRTFDRKMLKIGCR